MKRITLILCALCALACIYVGVYCLIALCGSYMAYIGLFALLVAVIPVGVMIDKSEMSERVTKIWEDEE